MSRIAVFYDEKCLLHSPLYEILSGQISQWFESPDRVRQIKSHLEKFPDDFSITTNVKDYGLDPILAIHDAEVKEGGDPEAGVVPEVMLHRNLLPKSFKANATHSIAKAGLHHFDMSSTVTAAYAAVQTALTATEAALNLKPCYLPGTRNGVCGGILASFALIRPPGHHATTNLCGGYCYLNNVIICTAYVLREHPTLKSVIIDVDFHHGNGVEEILSRDSSGAGAWRQRCKYISLHAHPDYPYYTTHLPTPLSKDVTANDYIDSLRSNLKEAVSWCNKNNIIAFVSLGLDTLFNDPIGGFAGFTCQEHYFGIGFEIGQFVHRVGAKTCFLLEGGYVVDKLGECVEGVLRGYMHGVSKGSTV